MKRHHPFTPTEYGRLLVLKTLLVAGSLRWSEWAEQTPFDDHYRVGWDNRFEPHQPAAHEVEP
jgi:hypothetical protein